MEVLRSELARSCEGQDWNINQREIEKWWGQTHLLAFFCLFYYQGVCTNFKIALYNICNFCTLCAVHGKTRRCFVSILQHCEGFLSVLFHRSSVLFLDCYSYFILDFFWKCSLKFIASILYLSCISDIESLVSSSIPLVAARSTRFWNWCILIMFILEET